MGRFEADDGVRVAHMFDADGMMNAVTFDPIENPGKILFRNRFIRTEGYLEDKRTKKMSARGIFGTMRSGGILKNMFRMDFKNVANTNVVYSDEKDVVRDGKSHSKGLLHALWEGGRPYLLDPLTLETISVSTNEIVDGILSENGEFSAHPRWDAREKVWVNFGQNFDPFKGTTVRKRQETIAK